MIKVHISIALGFAAALTASPAFADADLAKSKNCVACHSIERKMIGPAYKVMAEKYASDEVALKTLSEKVRKGGGGVWGPMPMPPQANVSEQEAEALVKWILSLK
ncbi:MAG: c-type cytochrome [Beijerinckiaceae bacterium]